MVKLAAHPLRICAWPADHRRQGDDVTMPAVVKLARGIDELVPDVGVDGMVSQIISSCGRAQGTKDRVLDATSHASLRQAGWRSVCGVLVSWMWCQPRCVREGV